MLTAMQPASLDLNLLAALDALLDEASVTRAAQRLRLSQPALSAALAKLRRHFDDELLRRVGNRNELTPLALQLKQRTGVAMESVQRVFASQPVFDPATADREFVLLGSDYGLAVVGQALGSLLYERAPHLRLRLGLHRPELVDHARETLRTVDGLLLPHGFLTDLPRTDLYTDRWMMLVSADNTRVGDRLTMDLLAELPWAMTYHSPTAYTPAGRQLQMLGIEPRVQVVVESFLALPFALMGTERIALVQGRLADHLVSTGTVRALPCPFDVVPLIEAMWWHPMNERDAAHTWLRELLKEACAISTAATDPTQVISATDDLGDNS
jgi:DNA-binding transcriptional LysR family regulator